MEKRKEGTDRFGLNEAHVMVRCVDNVVLINGVMFRFVQREMIRKKKLKFLKMIFVQAGVRDQKFKLA